MPQIQLTGRESLCVTRDCTGRYILSAIDCESLMAPLLRYARSRVRNSALAEDAVSEALLVGLESGQRFHSAAQAKAWTYGVLRHKLVDQLRRQGRETPAGDLSIEDFAERPDWSGESVWNDTQDVWNLPEQAFSQRQFLDFVVHCCQDLPTLQRHAFVMREILELEPARICRELVVTEGHLCVLVHRARLRLQEALLLGWELPPGLAKAKQKLRKASPAGTASRSSAASSRSTCRAAVAWAATRAASA